MPSTEEKVLMLQQRFDNHLIEVDARKKEERERWDRLIKINEANANSINDLTHATKGVVDAWQTSTNLGRFMKWLSGFAVIGAAYAWWLKTFPPG